MYGQVRMHIDFIDAPQMSTKLLHFAIGLAFFGIVCYTAVDIRLNAGLAVGWINSSCDL
jgi:hypothetical protein